MAPVVVPLPVIELLLDTGWLSVDESEERDAIGRAVTSMLNAMASEHTAYPENMGTRGQTATRLHALMGHEPDLPDRSPRPEGAATPLSRTRRLL